MSNLSATSNYSNLAPPANPAGSTTLPQKPFLDEVTKVNLEIKQLVDLIPKLRDLHDRATSSADSSPPAELDALAADTQTQRTTIRNSIRYLEADAVRSNDQTKSTQVKTLKRNFQGMLNMYMAEEQRYKNKNVEQITRQYKIVYPNASEAEAKEAAQMNWGNEGVFQTAVSNSSFITILLIPTMGLIIVKLRDSTRSRQVNAAAGAVLTRHNEIAQIEKTIMELAAMFEDMAQLVDAQEPAVQRAEENAIQTTQDVQKANIEIDKANEHARRRNRLKWWCLLVVVRNQQFQYVKMDSLLTSDS